MYRKNNKLRYDYIEQMMEINEIREMIMEEYIMDDRELAITIIDFYGLERIRAKYIDKFRDYSENHYSRTALKREEKVFQIKVLMAREFQHKVKEFAHYKRRLEQSLFLELDFDDKANIEFIKKYYLKHK